MEIDVEAEIAKYSKEMDEAEDTLAKNGEISTESWMLIKKYIFAAIAHSAWHQAKAIQNLPPKLFTEQQGT
jgi:hypothetical protein